MNGSDCPKVDPKSMRKVDFNCVSSRQLPTDVITVFLGLLIRIPSLLTREVVSICIPSRTVPLGLNVSRELLSCVQWASRLMGDGRAFATVTWDWIPFL